MTNQRSCLERSHGCGVSSHSQVSNSLAYINDMVNETLMKSLKNTNGNLINELHPDIDVRLNSCNLIVGKQGYGKTVLALTEIIKLSRITNDKECFHLLVYVTKNGDENDRSFQSLKHLIQIPIVTISESNIEDAIKTIVSAKSLYYRVKRDKLIDKIDDQQRNDMLDVLCVHDINYEFLHTIILFDDISGSKLFRDQSSYFSQLIRKLRHVNMCVFMLIQNFSGLKPFVKNEITTMFIFGSFNKQQLNYIHTQSASNLSLHEFQDLYDELCRMNNKHAYIVVQVTDGGNTYIRT